MRTLQKKVKLLSERDNIPQKSHHWCPLIKQVWCNNFSSPEILLWSLRWTSPQITQPTSFRCTPVLVLLKKGITKFLPHKCLLQITFPSPCKSILWSSIHFPQQTQTHTVVEPVWCTFICGRWQFLEVLQPLVLRLWVGAQALEKFQTTDRWEENISFLFSSSEED